MTIDDLLEEFPTIEEFMQLGLARTTWFNWKRKGYIPIKSQFLLEDLTKGALTANWDDVPQPGDRNG